MAANLATYRKFIISTADELAEVNATFRRAYRPAATDPDPEPRARSVTFAEILDNRQPLELSIHLESV